VQNTVHVTGRERHRIWTSSGGGINHIFLRNAYEILTSDTCHTALEPGRPSRNSKTNHWPWANRFRRSENRVPLNVPVSSASQNVTSSTQSSFAHIVSAQTPVLWRRSSYLYEHNTVLAHCTQRRAKAGHESQRYWMNMSCPSCEYLGTRTSNRKSRLAHDLS